MSIVIAILLKKKQYVDSFWHFFAFCGTKTAVLRENLQEKRRFLREIAHTYCVFEKITIVFFEKKMRFSSKLKSFWIKKENSFSQK